MDECAPLACHTNHTVYWAAVAEAAGSLLCPRRGAGRLHLLAMQMLCAPRMSADGGERGTGLYLKQAFESRLVGQWEREGGAALYATRCRSMDTFSELICLRRTPAVKSAFAERVIKSSDTNANSFCFRLPAPDSSSDPMVADLKAEPA